MTYEEEQRLHGNKVIELLNEINLVKEGVVKEKDFKIAETLLKCYEGIKSLHVINLEAMRENRSMSDHHRTHFAGMAMQSLIVSQNLCCNTVQQAFKLADAMVNYSKQGNGSVPPCR